MKSKPIVFLDTSIQVDRILGKRERKVKIEQQLADDALQFVSSHYVFMEFQRSVIADHAHVHNNMLSHDDWQELVTELHAGTRRYRPRALMRSMQIFTQMIVAGQMNRELALEFLKIQIEHGLSLHFWRNVTPVVDTVVCDLVQKGAQQIADEFQVADSCRKESAACSLPNFFDTHLAKIVAIRDHLAAHPETIKDQNRVARLLNGAIEDSNAVLGQMSCWPLGDIIIALQVPIGGQLWTTDRDFGPLADVLGLTLYNADL